MIRPLHRQAGDEATWRLPRGTKLGEHNANDIRERALLISQSREDL